MLLQAGSRLVRNQLFYTTQGHLTYISKQTRQSPIWICPQARRYLESPSAEIPPTGDPRLGQVDS